MMNMNIEFENRLRSIASDMEYPRTPDVAAAVIMRLRPSSHPRFILKRLAWSLTILLILSSSLLLVPSVRAAVIEFIQIGIVRIFPQPTEPPAEVIHTATPETFMPLTATPNASSPSLIPLLDQIAGETKLANAQVIAPYPLLLPSYPLDIELPDHVYIQDTEGVMTILVWVDPEQPERVTMSLHFIPVGHWAINKFGPVVLQETEVNGQRAIWAEGPYPLILRNGDILITRMIEGHVLIWELDDLTYRLETDISLEEAIKIAESLKPIP